MAQAAATVAQWEQWQHVPGIFDVAGPRSDGRLVVAAHETLSLMTDAGVQTSYAPGYAAPDGSESYIALPPGVSLRGNGCSFPRDDVYALDLRTSAPGVEQVSPSGTVKELATVSGVSTLGGIAFDTVGEFGHRLLVIGGAGTGRTRVFAVDCKGAVATIGTVATSLEGGIAIAPRSFGAYGGQLIAPNELDGNLYAVSAAGVLSTVVASGVPAGQDTGVESVGFVPPTGADVAYMADRLTAGNAHPGTDSLLRLSAAMLTQAGVRSGDALVGTEGGAIVVDVRCVAQCSASVAAQGPTIAHGEGTLLVVAAPAGPAPQPRAAPSSGVPAVVWALAVIGGVLLISAGATVIAVRRRAAMLLPVRLCGCRGNSRRASDR